MTRKNLTRIIDADKVIGKVDMSYDAELAAYESEVRHSPHEAKYAYSLSFSSKLQLPKH